MVKFSPVLESDSNKKVETGDAIVLYCEVSHPFAKVSWFKDGEELQVADGLNIQSDGNMRRIVIHSADASHSGVYTCETSGDVIQFNVDVAGKRYFNFYFNHSLIPCVPVSHIHPFLLLVQVLLLSSVWLQRRSSIRAAWSWILWFCSAMSPEKTLKSFGEELNLLSSVLLTLQLSL